MRRKIVIAGGSGYLGSLLIKKYDDGNTNLVILTRGNNRKDKNVSYIEWNAKTIGAWSKELEGADVVFNLVGKSVNCRYTEQNKREIIASRVDATTVIGQAIQQAKIPPKLWINAGSAAIYGNSGDIVKGEISLVGEGFSAEVCKQWEASFNNVDTPKTRKVFLRIGLVFDKDAWVLKPFLNLAKWGLGGTLGNGDQYVSWIHEEDFLNVLDYVIKHEDIKGVLNCSSPNPVTNKEFMKAVRKACSVPFGISHPAFLIRIGSKIIGTEADLALSGRRVVSKIMEEKKFPYKYPKLEDALHHLLKVKHS
jgi:uncharacterized protein (TIGR01777 family)